MNIAQHNTIVLDFIQRAKRRSIVPHQISVAAGEYLATLARCLQAQRILEIGTLWGYSTWWLYQGMQLEPAAQLITIEKELKHSTLAQEFFLATHLTAVQLQVGDAKQIVPRLAPEQFDLIFLDADRRDYLRLLPELLRVLRWGGLVIVDNIQIAAEHTNAALLQTFLQQLQQHPNLQTVMLQGNIPLALALKSNLKK